MMFKSKCELKQKIIIFFMIVWYFDLPCFSILPNIRMIFRMGKVLSLILCVILLIYDQNKQIMVRKNKSPFTKYFARNRLYFTITIVCYEGYIIINTIFHQGDLLEAVRDFIAIVGLTLVLNYWFSKNTKNMLSVLLVIFELLIYVNFILIFLCPEGIYNIRPEATKFYWLFGHQNQTILYVLNAIVISLLYYYIEEKKSGLIRTSILIFVGTIMIVKVWSATAIVGLGIFWMIVILYKLQIHLGVKTGLLASFIMFFSIVVFQKQSFFSIFIQNILHRSMTFSGRTKIWSLAMETIQEKPIWGYGYELASIAREHFGFSTPHNRYLYVLYQGGVVLFIVFILLYLIVSDSISKSKNSIAKAAIVGGIWSFMVQMQLESYPYLLFFLPLMLAGNINEIEDMHSIYQKTKWKNDLKNICKWW